MAFCSLAVIYLLLHAEFIGSVQVVVYAGAIMVLFLFVIMLLNLGRDEEIGGPSLRRGLGWLLGAALVAEGALLLSARAGPGTGGPPAAATAAGNTQRSGLLLYTRYLFPFELTSILLLVAMIGAVVIAAAAQPPRPRPRRPDPRSPGRAPGRTHDPAFLAAGPERRAVLHRHGRRAHAAQRDHDLHVHRADAERRQPHVRGLRAAPRTRSTGTSSSSS